MSPPPTRQQGSAWQGRPVNTTTNDSGSSNSTAATMSASSSSSSALSHQQDPLNRISSNRWNTLCKFDPKVSCSPTPPESVTPPPLSNCYRGSKHHISSNQISSSSDAPKDTTSSSSVPLVKFVCNVSVILKDVGMRDSDTQRLLRTMAEQLFEKYQKHPPDTVYFVFLDISQNQLTCQSIEQISKWFQANSSYARLRNFKVYKNEISDNGAMALASLISNQWSPVEELHLSHNNITAIGTAALFKSFAEAKSSSGSSRPWVYPRYDHTRGAQLPVWIRLEYNRINDTQAILSKWESETKASRKADATYYLSCFADRPNQPHGNKDPHCSPARCIRSGPNYSPLLHLYSFHHQSASLSPTATPLSSSATIVKTGDNLTIKGATGTSSSRTSNASLTSGPTSGGVKQSELLKSPTRSKQVVLAVIDKRKRGLTSKHSMDSTTISSDPKSIPPTKGKSERRSPQRQPMPSEAGTKKTLPIAVSVQPPSSLTTRAVVKEAKKSDLPSLNVYIPPEDRGESQREGFSQMSVATKSGGTSPTWIDSAVLDVGKLRRANGSNGSVSNQPSLSTAGSRGPTAEMSSLKNEIESPVFGRRTQHSLSLGTTDNYVMSSGDTKLNADDLFAVGATSNEETPNDLTATLGQTHFVDPVKTAVKDFFCLPSNTNRPPYNDLNPRNAFPKRASILNNCTQESPTHPSYEVPSELGPLEVSRSGPITSFSYPLYIFLDASAFSDMRLVQRKEKFSPFSFPAIYSMCQKKAFCHSLMPTPLVRRGFDGEELELLNASHSLILMAVNSMSDGLASLTETKPFLRNALLELDDDFIKPLIKFGVIEQLDDQPQGSEWMMYTSQDIEKAQSLGVSSASLKVLDFAFVWAHHLSKVSKPSAQASVLQASDGQVRPSFAVFLTSNPNVEQFFGYLARRYQYSNHVNNTDGALSAPSTFGAHNATPSLSSLRDTTTATGQCNLLCVNLDTLNQLLRDHFPSLMNIFESPYPFEPSEHPYSEILSADVLRRLLLSQRQLLMVDASKLGTPSTPYKCDGHSTRDESLQCDWWTKERQKYDFEVGQLKQIVNSMGRENSMLKGELRLATGFMEELIHRLKFMTMKSDQDTRIPPLQRSQLQMGTADGKRFDLSTLIMQSEAELDRLLQLSAEPRGPPQQQRQAVDEIPLEARNHHLTSQQTSQQQSTIYPQQRVNVNGYDSHRNTNGVVELFDHPSTTPYNASSFRTRTTS